MKIEKPWSTPLRYVNNTSLYIDFYTYLYSTPLKCRSLFSFTSLSNTISWQSRCLINEFQCPFLNCLIKRGKKTPTLLESEYKLSLLFPWREAQLIPPTVGKESSDWSVMWWSLYTPVASWGRPIKTPFCLHYSCAMSFLPPRQVAMSKSLIQ